MTMTLFATSPEAASMLARRLLPDAKILGIYELPKVATQQDLRDFWTTVRRMTAKTQSKHQRKSNPSSSGTLADR